MAAAKVYVEQLYTRGHGWPPWESESEVYPGDVGFFHDSGKLCRLFNVLVEKDDPINRGHRGTPDDFVPLRPLQCDWLINSDFFTPGRPIMTRTVTASAVDFQVVSDPIPAGVGVTYTCSRNLGAMLLPRSRTARVDIGDCKLVRDYIKRNIDSWYVFARQFFGEEQAPEGSLVLVRGCDKTESWVAAAFTERSVNAGLMFNGGLEPSGPGFKLKGSWKQTTYSFPETRDSEARAAPLTLSIEPTPTVLAAKFPPECRETVFVRVFKCWRRVGRLKIPKVIKAAAGPHDLPDADGDFRSLAVASGDTSFLEWMDSESVVEIDPQQPDFSKHPIDALLEYILQASPHSQYAIATDTDLYSIMSPGMDWADIPGAIQASELSVYDDGLNTARLICNDLGGTDRGMSIEESPTQIQVVERPRADPDYEFDVSEHSQRLRASNLEQWPAMGQIPQQDQYVRIGGASHRPSSTPLFSAGPLGTTSQGPRKHKNTIERFIQPFDPMRRAVATAVGSVDEESGGNGGKMRGPGACTHCKKLKMKCDFFPADANVCKRCKNSGHQCVVEDREPRSAPNKRKYLMQQLRQKDAVIESLRKQLTSPFFATPMSISNYKASGHVDAQSQKVVAWLDRLKTRPAPAARASLSPGAAASDAESSFDAGDDDEDSAEGTTASLVESERLIPDQNFPVGLFANLSLSATRKSTRVKAVEAVLANPDAQNEDDVGVANETSFMPGPATDIRIRQRLLEQTSPPGILVYGLVTPDDVDALFTIFFKRINIFFPLLDPVIHTPSQTFSRCPFLFTVICAVSSRYYDTEPERAEKDPIYPLAIHFARLEASTALIKGWKSVELCQAYILMAAYCPPAHRWEEDRAWIFTGLAIRIAMDLGMHLPSWSKPQSEQQEREALNKTRTWMICYSMDRSMAAQYGKPCTINDEYMECYPPNFYASSQCSSVYDIHICAYNALLRIVGQMHTELCASDLASISTNTYTRLQVCNARFAEELARCYNVWCPIMESCRIPNDEVCNMRIALWSFMYSYSRLLLNSSAFKLTYVHGAQQDIKPIFDICLDAARETMELMIARLAPSGYMRFAPDEMFMIASFASAFLFNLLRPQFQALISAVEEIEILKLIGRLIETLSSPAIAIDDRHTPKVYARFLANLLSQHHREHISSLSLGAAGSKALTMDVELQTPGIAGYHKAGFVDAYGVKQEQPVAKATMRADHTFDWPGLAPQLDGFELKYVDSFSDEGYPSMQGREMPAWSDQKMLSSSPSIWSSTNENIKKES